MGLHCAADFFLQITGDDRFFAVIHRWNGTDHNVALHGVVDDHHIGGTDS
ncbi:hypothetical protein [Sphingobacterium sp. ML3W]|nr:hypothetical protein [Sphingobacterium sp. ML3W]